MDIKRLVVLIIAAILVLSLIFGVIFSLYRLIRSRQATPITNRSNQTFVTSPVPQTGNTQQSQNPTPPQTPPSNTKSYNLQGLQINFPKEWGLLTCRNSQNIEFDPANPQDQLNIACDRAVKPITFQTSYLTGCANGQIVNLGGQQVIKVVSTTAVGTDYKWCISSPLAIEITHRVSQTDTRSAFSKTDYSQAIEQIISTFRGEGPGGS